MKIELETKYNIGDAVRYEKSKWCRFEEKEDRMETEGVIEGLEINIFHNHTGIRYVMFDTEDCIREDAILEKL
jgi:hypothetical protein